MAFETFDRSKLRLLPLAERVHDLHYNAMQAAVFGSSYCHPSLSILTERIRSARASHADVTIDVGQTCHLRQCEPLHDRHDEGSLTCNK